MDSQEIVIELKKRGLTSRGIMGIVGINSATIRKWLNGSREVPARHRAALERFLKTGTAFKSVDAVKYEGYIAAGNLRRDGTRAFIPAEAFK